MSTETTEHRLLGVFAHPDDETIAAGLTLAAAVAAGVDVSVVTCTRGERGEVVPPALAHLARDGAALGARREQELSGALAALGVHRHLFLDQVPGLEEHRPARFVDSGMTWLSPRIAGPVPDAGPDAFSLLDLELTARLLAVVVRHLRPTALLTEEPGGGYGHPDHVQAHRVAMRAIEIAADPAAADGWTPPADGARDPLDGLEPWRVSTVLWVAQAEPVLRAATDELQELVARTRESDGAAAFRSLSGGPLQVAELGTGEDLPGLVVPTAQIAVELDARAVTRPVLDALRAHETQVQAVAPVTGRSPLAGHLALSNDALLPLLDRVHLRVAPGYDATDLIAVLTGAASAPTGTAPGTGPTDDDAPAPLRPAAAADRTSDRAAGPSDDPSATDSPGRGGRAAGLAMCVVVGVVMALLGTVVHRYAIGDWPVGILLGLAGVLAGGIAARAVAGANGLLVVVIAVVLTSQAMTFVRPGQDILVTDQPIGYVWLFGAPAVCLVAAFLPRRWFADTRVRVGATRGEVR